ncbi:PAQR family membrane homeostasis protein TrhA [Breznakia blatticola]|nr:hemolysin III family protein [Breznakia blatticola]
MMRKQSKLDAITIPPYTKGEEIFNMVSHIVGGVLGIVATVLCVVIAARHQNGYGIVSGAIFGSTMILLYTTSSVYHGLSPRLKAKKVFRILDHCAIYLLVAGTYTPIALCTIREYDNQLGWTLCIAIWLVAIAGMILTASKFKKFQILEVIIYLAMGWSVLLAKDAVLTGVGFTGLLYMLIGGIAYSIGVIFYALGKKMKYSHSIFHLFILVGSFFHFLAIVLYVM